MITTRHLLVLLCAAVLTTRAFAAEIEKFYYVGDVKLSSDTGEPRGLEVILLEKTHDSTNSLIVERAIEVKADGSVLEFTMNMKVAGATFTIADTKETIQGNGTLFGVPWKWTYFKASYESKNGVKIEDENYMTDPNILVARKKIMLPDGKVLMYMDITLKAVTQQTFEILSASLLKK
jgi:hypothetical protein